MSNEIRKKVKETALKIIEENGYTTVFDVADRLGITHASASQFLRWNYKKWGLRMGFVDHSSRVKIYAKDYENLKKVNGIEIIKEEASTKTSLEEWIIRKHKESKGYGLDLTNLKINYMMDFGKKPDIYDLLKNYKNLIEKGKLKFKNGLTKLS